MKKVLAIAAVTVGLGFASIPASAQGYVASNNDRLPDPRPEAGTCHNAECARDKGSLKNAVCSPSNAVWQCGSGPIRWQ